MTGSKYNRVFWAFFMSFMMSNILQVASAEAAHEMIATTAVVEALSRSQNEEKIQLYLGNSKLQEELVKSGLSTAEVTKRIASLSDSELRDMAAQMDQARYGGEPYSILMLVLVIVLIVFLVKRI